MIIALTGTPGTGKTSVSSYLEKAGFEVVDLTEFVKDKELGVQRDEFEVDTAKMVEALEDSYLEEGEDVVIEGHLSHHFPSDLCIVLRCSPDELRDRLSDRDYSQQKIDENIESEILDTILIESVERQENIFELDTTSKETAETASRIKKAIKNKETGYGSVDWTSQL